MKQSHFGHGHVAVSALSSLENPALGQPWAFLFVAALFDVLPFDIFPCFLDSGFVHTATNPKGSSMGWHAFLLLGFPESLQDESRGTQYLQNLGRPPLFGISDVHTGSVLCGILPSSTQHESTTSSSHFFCSRHGLQVHGFIDSLLRALHAAARFHVPRRSIAGGDNVLFPPYTYPQFSGAHISAVMPLFPANSKAIRSYLVLSGDGAPYHLGPYTQSIDAHIFASPSLPSQSSLHRHITLLFGSGLAVAEVFEYSDSASGSFHRMDYTVQIFLHPPIPLRKTTYCKVLAPRTLEG
ncbi:hypothetical protein FB451DRAFT_1365086 [Mycena latifolia]|nr:hypothetical protein FB451DRAFT_1365086 [Mycena latifolia]